MGSAANRGPSGNVTLQDLIAAYRGKLMLSNLDVLHSRLNPDNLQGEALNEADLDVPDDSPQNLLSVAKLIPLLQDMQSADVRMRCIVMEVIGNYHMRTHLHRVENCSPGVIFEAHALIQGHRDVNSLFMGPAVFTASSPQMDALERLSVGFALGITWSLKYADKHGLREEAVGVIGQTMRIYGEYFEAQTAEWSDNPVKILAGLGATDGHKHARELVGLGLEEIRQRLAKYLHITRDVLMTHLDDGEYCGPCAIFNSSGGALWAELGHFSEQQLPLARCVAWN